MKELYEFNATIRFPRTTQNKFQIGPVSQEQIFQTQTNVDEKKNGLSEQEQSINKKKKIIKISLSKLDLIYI